MQIDPSLHAPLLANYRSSSSPPAVIAASPRLGRPVPASPSLMSRASHLIARTGAALSAVSSVPLLRKQLSGGTALHSALAAGDIHEVRRLLDLGANVNSPGRLGQTPLNLAAGTGHLDCVRALLAVGGIRINRPDQTGQTPLHRAAEAGHLDVVKALLAGRGIAVNQVDQLGRTALHRASSMGRLSVVHELLAAVGSRLQQPGFMQRTPLHCAAAEGHAEVVKALLGAPGINVNQPELGGQSPLRLAVSAGHDAVVESLLAAPGINVNQVGQDGKTSLAEAASSGHMNIVCQLLAAPGIQMDTALPALADSQGHAAIAECLREALRSRDGGDVAGAHGKAGDTLMTGHAQLLLDLASP